MSQSTERHAIRAAAAPAPAAGSPSSISILPATLNLSIYAGDTLEMRVSYVDGTGAPIDMSGTWAAQVRAKPDADDPPLTTFEIDETDEANGVVTLTLDAAATRAIPTGPAAVWDLQVTQGGVVRTTHAGTITTTEDVTRP